MENDMESGDNDLYFHNQKFGSLYLDTFNSARETVLRNEGYLFTQEERSIFERFDSLDLDSQKLYVRLHLRADGWIRTASCSYAEIEDIGTARDNLVSLRFAEILVIDLVETDIIFPLLTVEELKSLGRQFRLSRLQGTKKELIQRLQVLSNGQTCIADLTCAPYPSASKPRLKQKLLSEALLLTGPCIKLSQNIRKIFDRVNLVYLRSQIFDETNLRTAVLARFRKRHYANYLVLRSTEVFKTRTDLLEYEAALELQANIEVLLENNGLTARLSEIKEVLMPIYEKWKLSISAQGPKNGDRDHYLIRFTATWIHTRLVQKLALVLAKLGEYDDEYDIYCALLSQRIYRQGKRGEWYTQKALLEDYRFGGARRSPKERRFWREQALLTCTAGIEDLQTHLIFHFDLQKRIVKLEKLLRISSEIRHRFDHVKLEQASEKIFYGHRLNDPQTGLKTVWQGPNNQPCSVEELCLQKYRQLGWTGYHTEGGIIKTTFAYLFWDIIFLPVPFVFETGYQTAPLDISTEAFYLSRSGEINDRLSEIQNGKAAVIIQNVYDREAEKQTMCVGLDWRFELSEILAVAECLGGVPLAAICKIFCQDFQQRQPGMPDLFLWNLPKRTCMFAEVKSPNDRLSDAQRLWIDVLIRAGIQVELSRVTEIP
ncbi:VRR-NUC domain-containing protein [Lipomyces oligophaga]|uniref:VRR-NUC domain-containing protein n=1 Tax=Lipomyces oligophaga TaxID=45792 RepID=UPI0034CD9E20